MPTLFFDAECASRGVKALSAGTDGEIHGRLPVDEEGAALCCQIDFDMFFSRRIHQRFIDNDIEMGAVSGLRFEGERRGRFLRMSRRRM